MNKLTKTQKSQLLGVLIGTLVVMAALWYFGVTAKEDELSKTQKGTAQMVDTLKYAEGKMRQSEEIANKMEAREQALEKRELILAPDRDAYAWMISTMNPFVQSHKGVAMHHYSQAEVSEIGLIPGFPYKWATFHVDGSGYYHDLGKFFSDLENNFPYFRVQNLDMSATGSGGIDPEKLNVSFDVVVPVRVTETK